MARFEVEGGRGSASGSVAEHGDVAGRRRAVALLAVVVAVTSVLGLAVGLFWPEADDEGRYTYAVVEPMREFWRAWLLFAAVNLVVGLPALAIAGFLLAPRRGRTLAILGGALMWLGCAPYAAGVGGLATVYYFGTEREALEPAAGAALLDYLDGAFFELWAPAIVGAVLVALGQVVLAVALWRARTVPRWIPVLLATIVLSLVLGETSGWWALLVSAPGAIGAVGLAWYLWRREAASGATLRSVGASSNSPPAAAAPRPRTEL